MIQSAILVLSGFGFLSALAIFIYYFGEYLLQSAFLLQISIGLLVFAFGSFVLLRFSPQVRAVSAIVLVSSLAPFWALELAMQMEWYASAPEEPANSRPNREARSIPEVLADLRSKGMAVYPAVPPYALLVHRKDDTISELGDFLPVSGVSTATTLFCNEADEWIIYESDEYGFNNPRGIWGRANMDILAVGDSFTHGACIAPDLNFVALIRRKFPGTVSIGQSSNGPLLMLASLREFLATAKPSTVLWFYFEENDIPTDLPAESRVTLLMNYLEDSFSQGLAGRQPEIDRRLKTWLGENADQPVNFANPIIAPGQFAGFNVTDFLLLRNLRNRLHVTIGPKPRELKLFGQIMETARREVEAAGARLTVVYLPGERRFSNLLGAIFQNLLRERVLFILDKKLGIPVIDLVPVFESHADPRSLFLQHYTKEGNVLVANQVLQALNQSNLKSLLPATQ